MPVTIKTVLSLIEDCNLEPDIESEIIADRLILDNLLILLQAGGDDLTSFMAGLEIACRGTEYMKDYTR